MSKRLWALETRSRSSNGEKVSGYAMIRLWLRFTHPFVSVLEDIEEEGQIWPIKDRRKPQKQQQEQEIEDDVAQEIADQEATDDMEQKKEESTTKSVKSSDFY